MFEKQSSERPERRPGVGTTATRTLARAAVMLAAGLGLAACVGPYGDDGYAHNRRADPSYDTGYDQRRGYDTEYDRRRNAYGQDPYTPTDRQRWNYGWWRGSDDLRNRHGD